MAPSGQPAAAWVLPDARPNGHADGVSASQAQRLHPVRSALMFACTHRTRAASVQNRNIMSGYATRHVGDSQIASLQAME